MNKVYVYSCEVSGGKITYFHPCCSGKNFIFAPLKLMLIKLRFIETDINVLFHLFVGYFSPPIWMITKPHFKGRISWIYDEPVNITMKY